ncbi:MAG: DNA polymerase III subunit alpha [Candidatus Vogelbacteria bacterium]|nr:DNA polymerase III subunit alpha [Candidatus Vogelbacteria bacterium]
MSFVHLHTHSHYSLLDGLSKTDELVKQAKAFGMSALAVTDHGNLYGAIEFYKACKKAEIKPIIGVEAYVALRSRFDKDAGVDSKRYHLTLLAENFTGYQNLLKLITASYLEGYYYKPRIDKELLRKHHEGIICLSGCPAGELAQALAVSDLDRSRHIISEFIDIFGKDNYFLEVMKHEEVEGNANVVKNIQLMAKEFDLPIVGTWDSHYLHPDDNEAQDTLIAINTGAEVGKASLSMKGGNYSFISPAEAEKIFQDIPGAVANTLKIAERCNLELTIGKFVFPNFAIPEGTTADEILLDLGKAGLAKRGLADSPAANERLLYELDIIKMKGYASYFLVVEDLIRYARENGIYYNIRGSVAGSITTYVLDITKIDPLDYKIPFERFLNPERPSAPDIDMDFADNRRDEIIEYAKRKYGADKVAQIGTFGTMAARGSVRDVARALGYPYGIGDRLSKMIPMGSQGFPMTIDRALELVPELKEAYDTERDTQQIIDLSKKIEGGARHISVHAAGVVISPAPLTDYTPLQYDPKGESLITQYDMYSVGEDGVGLTKFDFLGLRNLAILADVIKLVEKIHNQKVDLDTIPMDDKKTFEMLARGETEGLFQLNGAGMTKWLKELRPSTIHDINAMVALYRPGPMQFIPDYIARKHNPKLISYLDPSLEHILVQTYGVLVYQDDLLIMAHDLAGYTWGEVDKFRKAVGKKIPEEMLAQKEKFIGGCIKHTGWSKEKATEIWTWIEPFAAYGFNKAHSASYGRVAYQTAYMKANYPVAYMSACLTAESGDVEQIAVYVNEAKRMNIKVLPPHVNDSFGGFTAVAEPGKSVADSRFIRFGLYTIKNLGTDISDAIIAERKTRGPFTSYTNFLERIIHKNVNRKSLEALIKSGALDDLGFNRSTMLGNIEEALGHNRDMQKSEKEQASLFGIMEDKSTVPSLKLKEVPPVDQKDILTWEKELLGLYISGHPLEAYADKFTKLENSIRHNKHLADGTTTTVGGIIEEVKKIFTKKGDQMAFVRLADLTDSLEVVVFSKPYEQYKNLLEVDKCVAVRGKISYRNNEPSLLVEAIKEL